MMNFILANSAYAATAGDLIGKIKANIISPIIQLFFALATVVFIWGVIEMLRNADNEEARTQGKQHMIWGLVGLFIMIAAGWLVSLLCVFFGIGTDCASVK
jgi:uncharacterized membrane protein